MESLTELRYSMMPGWPLGGGGPRGTGVGAVQAVFIMGLGLKAPPGSTLETAHSMKTDPAGFKRWFQALVSTGSELLALKPLKPPTPRMKFVCPLPGGESAYGRVARFLQVCVNHDRIDFWSVDLSPAGRLWTKMFSCKKTGKTCEIRRAPRV